MRALIIHRRWLSVGMLRQKYVTGRAGGGLHRMRTTECRMPSLVDVAWLILGCQKEAGR